MSKKIQYRQYRLKSGTKETVTWLPERHKGKDIEVGVVITLKDHTTGEHKPGLWEVMSRSETTQAQE